MVFVALNGALTVALGSGWYDGKKLFVSPLVHVLVMDFYTSYSFLNIMQLEHNIEIQTPHLWSASSSHVIVVTCVPYR
jgi:hypothetical protein